MRPRFSILLMSILAAGCGARTLTVGPEFKVAPVMQGNQRSPSVFAVDEFRYLVVKREQRGAGNSRSSA